MADIPERDWRYLSSIKEGMLEELSRRINDDVRRILGDQRISEDEKRHKVYRVVHDRDRIVGDCFNDWRRSRIMERCWALRRHRLLTQAHLEHLAPDTQKGILIFETK